MNRYDAINAELAEIRTSLDPITAELSKLAAVDDLTEGQHDRYTRTLAKGELLAERRDELEAERRDLDAQVFATQQQKTDELRAGIESGRYVTEAGCDLTYPGTGPTLARSSKVANPWARPVDGYSSSELRSAAISALERTENATKFATDVDQAARDRILAAVERDDGDEIAQWAVVASDPCYATAFVKLLQDPRGAHRSWSDGEVKAYGAARAFAQRAAMQETSTHGSELVPAFLDPTIRIQNAGARSDIREAATVYNTGTAVWSGVASSGVTAEWTSELSEMTDASPVFTQPTVTAYKADVYVEASWEVLQDTTIEQQLGTLFADARTRLEDAAWATGSGVGQPTGIITTLSATTSSRVSSTTNGAFGALDLFNLGQQLPARYQQNARWAFNPTVGIEVRKFALSSGNVSSAFWTDLGGGEPPQLLGYPIAHSTGMMTSTLSSATASSDNLVVLADFREYVITDRAGAFIATNDMIMGPQRRPIGATGLVYWWRTGGKLINADAGRLLVV